MPLSQTISISKNITVYMWALGEELDALVAMCNGVGISTSVIGNVRSPRRACEILAERLLLRHIVGSNVELSHTEYGAPYICGSDLNISITHTRGYVAIATSYDAVVGIDIESPTERTLKVRNKFLNSREQEWISADDIHANTIAWTAKEAMYKVSFTPGLDFSDDLLIHPFNIQKENTIQYQGELLKGETTVRNFVLTTIHNNDLITTIAEVVE